ncbi:MAG: hypothetical protein E7590_03990 [Ruminococcaceae bacterium]|nr:hypothetical protein [Oscillospiraceae bacterium]
MNIKKIDRKKHFLMPIAERMLLLGMPPILLSLLRLLLEVRRSAPYSAATASYFGEALTYPLAAFLALTALALIADRAAREDT